MWLFDLNGKRTEASVENANGMLDSKQFSTLWPRGTDEEEMEEFEALLNDTSEADAIVRASNRPVNAREVLTKSE